MTDEKETQPSTSITWQELGGDLLGFLATVVIATRQNWQARDLAWSLWTSSLLLGYVFIFIIELTGPASREKNIFARFGKTIFFFFHFGLFHLVHAMFLSVLFPLVGGGFFDFVSPVEIVWNAISLYWPLALTSAISRGRLYLEAYQSGSDASLAYRNVIRMHIFIMLIFFLGIFGTIFGNSPRYGNTLIEPPGGVTLYVLLFFYFFPIERVRQRLGLA